MDLKQLLTMLQGVSGPNSSGEYSARCPAHDDHTPTLTVTVKQSAKDGKERIMFNCHKGCPQDAILQALGLQWKDLIVNPDEPGRSSGSAAKRQQSAAKKQREPARTTWGPDEVMRNPDGTVYRDEDGKEYRVRTVDEQGRPLDENGEVIQGMMVDPKTGKLVPQKTEIIGGVTVHTVPPNEEPKKDEPVPDWDHPDRVYSYTDEEGRELFQVVRLHYKDGKPGKTFRQRKYDPADPKANRSGFVNSVPAEIRDSTLYRMPQVIRAIAEGKPVYVVEGEKDVETLERLGHVATCNPGGAGKWRTGYSQRLKDADVIILPDNDSKEKGYTGQNHALDVALKLQGYAKRVRLVDLKEACPDLPEKGDISDMVAIMGDVDAMDALARQVAATGDFDPDAVPFWLTPMEQASRLYAAVVGYGISDGCIAQITGSEIKPLSDFVVLPRMELERDDGVTVSKHFVLDGWNRKGKKLKRVVIPADDLDTMNWVTRAWGFDAALTPGSTTKAKVSWVIKQVGQMTAKRITEYSHTGWRKIGGQYCYLYHGGAVGMDGITVDMGDALKTYRLDGSGAPGFDGIPYRDAAETSLRIREIMKEEVGIALLGTMYLAPLREFLNQTDIVPAFALFLHGSTGTHKTTAAALGMAHYGNFHGKNPPASFNDTGNQIRAKAFLVKDAPILVDDFHPTKSLQEKRQMSAIAQTLSRAFGDGSDRGRLNADRTLQTSKPPRSVAVITGEDLPDIGASGLARYFVVDIDKGDVPVGKELTEMQELARRGYLQKAMRGYIMWLLKQTDGMPERLHDLFLRFREDVRKESSGQHDRAPEAVACILIGYQMMLNYMRDLGLFDTDTAIKMLISARRQLIAASEKQAKSLESEKPTRIFLDNLAELLASKQVALKDLTVPDAKDPPPTEKMAGYMDAQYYYLLPNVAFAAVSRLCREQGTEFPVSLKALYNSLRADGILENVTKGDSPAKLKRLDGKVRRVLCIPAAELDGPKAEVAQVAMTEVSSEEIPDEWK